MGYDKILDLEIPFPEIEAVSDAQKHYAERLREEYIVRHEERFREIDEIMQTEVDMKIRELNPYREDEHFTSYGEDYTEPERACLFGVSAGGIIATLKDALGR